VAEREFRRMISLPNHPALSDEDVAYIIDTIRRYPA
jgi:dTDP-4-amino-4,6-dideoxygalactose transaminase